MRQLQAANTDQGSQGKKAPTEAKPNNKEGNNSAAPAAKQKTNLPHTLQARYKLGEILGEGGYSIVKLGISTIDKKKVAVKIVTRAGLSSEDEQSLRSEVKILSALNHPNVVRALDFFEEDKYFYVVMEYLDGGELFDRIVKKTFYNEKEARDLVKVLLTAIKYLHDKHIVHRDLKPENLLMTSKDDDAGVKLADFGFAVIAEGFSITNQCGTPGYIAPEILENKAYGKQYILSNSIFCCYVLSCRQACRHVVIRSHFIHLTWWLSTFP